MTNFEYYTTAENGSEEFTEAVKKLAYRGHRNIINCEDILKFLQEAHKPILDDVEREYLSHIIKPFKNKVIYIKKNNCKGFELEEILIFYGYDNSDSDSISGLIELPKFKENTMYNGMKVGRKYTLKELNL